MILPEKNFPMTCPRHGDYEAGMKPPFHLDIVPGDSPFTPCPRCVAEALNPPPATEQAAADHAAIFRSGIPKRFREKTFDDYLDVGKASCKAVLAVSEYVQHFSINAMAFGTSIILAGYTGTGKTHLACAAGIELIGKGYSARYIPAWQIYHGLFDVLRGDQSMQDVLEEMCKPPLLIIDDCECNGPADRADLFRVVNARYEQTLPTMVVVTLPQGANDADWLLADRIGQGATDRLLGHYGILVPFTWKSYRR